MVPRLSKKRKTQKKWLRFIIRCLSRFYNLYECDKSHPPLFTQERQKSVAYLYYLAWFNPLYRQSENSRMGVFCYIAFVSQYRQRNVPLLSVRLKIWSIFSLLQMQRGLGHFIIFTSLSGGVSFFFSTLTLFLIILTVAFGAI